MYVYNKMAFWGWIESREGHVGWRRKRTTYVIKYETVQPVLSLSEFQTPKPLYLTRRPPASPKLARARRVAKAAC